MDCDKAENGNPRGCEPDLETSICLWSRSNSGAEPRQTRQNPCSKDTLHVIVALLAADSHSCHRGSNATSPMHHCMPAGRFDIGGLNRIGGALLWLSLTTTTTTQVMLRSPTLPAATEQHLACAATS